MDELERLAAESVSDVDLMSNVSASTGEVENEPAEDSIEEVDDVVEDGDSQDGDDDTAEEESDEEESDESDLEDDEEDTDESTDDDDTKSVDDVHEVTIDGEATQVSLQDLKDNYSGKQAWDKKFSELASEKATHTEAVKQFDNNANQFQTLVSEGKAQEALDFVIEMAGLDRNQFVETYVSQLAPNIAKYLELSPDERKQRALKQQVEYYKNEKIRADKQQAALAESKDLGARVEAVMKDSSMDLERFESLQKELIKFGVENVTPESVGQYHALVVQQDVAVEVLKEINPELVADKSAMDYLLSLQKNNPGIKKEDLQAKAEKAFIDALSDRVKKDSKAAKPKKVGSAEKATKDALKKIVTFDDLENINLLDLMGE